MRILICAAEAPTGPTNEFRLMLSALVPKLRTTHDVSVLAFRASDQPTGSNTDVDLSSSSGRGATPSGTLVRSFAR